MAPRRALPSVCTVFGKILVGYAGDGPGRDAVALSSQFARSQGAAVSVAYPYHPLLAGAACEVAEQRVREELLALLGEDDPLAQGARLRWSNASWPTRALHELAAFEGSDLIVFGAASERAGAHAGLMVRTVHRAPCAVAVAPEGYAQRPRASLTRIAAGSVGTAEGRAAVAMARELAAAAGVQARLLEVKGNADPCAVLLDASQTLDLLILGSRAYGPLRHVLLGVSAAVMSRADCPVLVLPRGTACSARAA